MKRDIKLNMGMLSETAWKIEQYLGDLDRIENASGAFLEKLREQDGVSYETLSAEWNSGIMETEGELRERLQFLKELLDGYIAEMESFVAPDNEDAVMRVDRNDIWWNLKQIDGDLSHLEDICMSIPSSYADYRHCIMDYWTDNEAAIRAEEDAEAGKAGAQLPEAFRFPESDTLCAEGYFEFQVEDETYGIYIPENIDVFMVSIYWWFYYFLEAILILNKTNYVLISDIEKAGTWIELKKNGEELYISKVFAEKPEGSSSLESKIIPNIKYKYWKDKKVLFMGFKAEVLNKAKSYLKDLKCINDEIHKDIQNLESLIQKVDNE